MSDNQYLVEERLTRLERAEQLAAAGNVPILEALASWGNGELVPTFDEIIEQYGVSFLGSLGFLRYDKYTDQCEKEMRERTHDSIELYIVRDAAIVKYGFTLPSAELLGLLFQHQPIIEIGAGAGYMTKLMRHCGIDVVGTDSNEKAYGFRCGAWDPIQEKLTAVEAVRYYFERTVFCAWPSYQEDWFHKALKAMARGQYLVAVEEDACATEAAWRYLRRKFDHISNVPIPSWPSVHDTCAIWRKR